VNKTSGFSHGVSNNALGLTHDVSKMNLVSLMFPINRESGVTQDVIKGILILF
jgi:hypothetical protein